MKQEELKQDTRPVEDQIRDEFLGILSNHYEELPETRGKFVTDKRLKDFDIVVVRKTNGGSV